MINILGIRHNFTQTRTIPIHALSVDFYLQREKKAFNKFKYLNQNSCSLFSRWKCSATYWLKQCNSLCKSFRKENIKSIQKYKKQYNETHVPATFNNYQLMTNLISSILPSNLSSLPILKQILEFTHYLKRWDSW